ncbi:hypothetical protein AB0P32_07155 [Streptomyces sp. NPDC085995]|uniref:hypothetical protein n=1 Tax=Streptomyces sp. NPDC085995 TaxID=3154861 RepID=UPI0034226EC4
MVGAGHTRLIVLRGNSASGKSSVAAGLREWYRSLDLLPGGAETVIGADSGLAATVDRILRETGLADLPPLDC